MAASNASPNPAGLPMERDLEIVRVFDAPRELVFRAWTIRNTWRDGGDPSTSPIGLSRWT